MTDPAWIIAQQEMHERHAMEHGPSCRCQTYFPLPPYDEEDDEYTTRQFLREIAEGLGIGLLILALIFLIVVL